MGMRRLIIRKENEDVSWGTRAIPSLVTKLWSGLLSANINRLLTLTLSSSGGMQLMSQDFQSASAHQATVPLPTRKAAVIIFCRILCISIAFYHQYKFFFARVVFIPLFKTVNFGNLPWEFKIFGKTNNVPLCFSNFLYGFYFSCVGCLLIKNFF